MFSSCFSSTTTVAYTVRFWAWSFFPHLSLTCELNMNSVKSYSIRNDSFFLCFKNPLWEHPFSRLTRNCNKSITKKMAANFLPMMCKIAKCFLHSVNFTTKECIMSMHNDLVFIRILQKITVKCSNSLNSWSRQYQSCFIFFFAKRYHSLYMKKIACICRWNSCELPSLKIQRSLFFRTSRK